MEAIIVLLLLAILAVPVILLIWFKVSTSSLIKEAILKIHSLNVKVDQLREDVVSPKVISDEDEKVFNDRVERLIDIMPEVEAKEATKDVIEKEEEQVKEEIKPIPELVPIKTEKPKKTVQKAAITAPKKKKRDIEKFVGENLLNKVGIGVLVLGIAYFVKYAIDNNWINEVGRVVIGLLSGGLLTFLAHKIRKSYKAFSSVLVGGAMAVFYYTISIGFHDYQLFTQPIAFGLMVGVTAFSVLLSISYDKKELAILALVGAFSTPLMLSTGQGNYIILFTYVAIVNVGMLVLAYFRKWNLVNILSLAFTVLLFGSWFVAKVVNGVNPPYQGALLFASLFYGVFFIMHIINNLKEKRKFKAYEFVLLLATTGLYYAVGMSVFHLSGNNHLQGLFTVCLGVFNLLFAYPLYKRNNVDKSLLFLLMGLVLSFVSLAAPVQLEGNYITLFWITEMVLLLWLGQKANIRLIKYSSMIIYGLAMVSLMMDWEQIYFAYRNEHLPVIINKGFITTVFAALGSIVYVKLLTKEGDKMGWFTMKHLIVTSKIIVAALIYFAGVFELGYQIEDRLNHYALATLSVLAYSLIYLSGLMLYAKQKGAIMLQKGCAIAVLALIALFPMFNLFERTVRNDVLFGQLNSLAVLVNYLNFGLVIVLGAWLVKQVKLWFGKDALSFKAMVWVLSFLGLIIFSMQLNHQTIVLFYDVNIENMHFVNKQTIKIGYPILWGVGSFLLMLVGMKYKQRVLRIVSLSLFTVVLLKLFLFDIKGASEAGKIVAFILLGILLLVISFMYQKLKNLLLDDKNTKS